MEINEHFYYGITIFIIKTNFKKILLDFLIHLMNFLLFIKSYFIIN